MKFVHACLCALVVLCAIAESRSLEAEDQRSLKKSSSRRRSPNSNSAIIKSLKKLTEMVAATDARIAGIDAKVAGIDARVKKLEGAQVSGGGDGGEADPTPAPTPPAATPAPTPAPTPPGEISVPPVRRRRVEGGINRRRRDLNVPASRRRGALRRRSVRRRSYHSTTSPPTPAPTTPSPTVEACKGKEFGDSCDSIWVHGQKFTGVCKKLSSKATKLFCMPTEILGTTPPPPPAPTPPPVTGWRAEYAKVGGNCHCGRRIGDYPTEYPTAEACAGACTNNPKCNSFGIWTEKSAGYCVLYDTWCWSYCQPQYQTNVEKGYRNDNYNKDKQAPTTKVTTTLYDGPTTTVTTTEIEIPFSRRRSGGEWE